MGTPIILADRVLVAITTTGTGTYSLGPAVTGYLSPDLAGVASGARVAYVVVDSLTTPTSFEIGEGLYTAGAPATLTRAQIRRNTAGGTAAVNWASGTKYIMLTPSAANLPALDTDGAIPITAGGTGGTTAATALAALGALALTGGTVTGNTTLDGAVVINEGGADKDTRIEGDTDQNLLFVDASTDRVGIGTATPAAKLDVNGAIRDNLGSVRAVPQNAQTAGYTLVAADAGKHIAITTGGVTIPASVFSAGDIVTLYNASGSAQTITQGASTTVYWGGTSSTGNRMLSQRGIATILCVAANTFVISGAGLS